jgi:hypothetical protein
MASVGEVRIQLTRSLMCAASLPTNRNTTRVEELFASAKPASFGNLWGKAPRSEEAPGSCRVSECNRTPLADQARACCADSALAVGKDLGVVVNVVCFPHVGATLLD